MTDAPPMREPASFQPRAVGQSMPRVDGRLKVTGAARYTAEHALEGLLHAVVVGSAIPFGRVASIEATETKALPGVVAVISSADMPRLKPLPDMVQGIQFAGEGGLIEMLLPLQDDRIHYAGQSIAIVVAATFEDAVYAASRLRICYDEEAASLDLNTATHRSQPQTYCGMQPLQLSTGDPVMAFDKAEVKFERTYDTPPNYHAAIELLSTVAAWEQRNGREVLRLWDTTRVIKTAVEVFAHCLDIRVDDIDLVVKFLGGSFGSKAWMFGNTLLVAACARMIGRPLKIEWTRAQMCEVNGYRPASRQTIHIGASRDGRIASLRHHGISATSTVSGYPEPVTGNRGVSRRRRPCSWINPRAANCLATQPIRRLPAREPIP